MSTVDITPGSRWVDTDPREKGRTVTVDSVTDDYVFVRTPSGRITRVALARFRKAFRPEAPS